MTLDNRTRKDFAAGWQQLAALDHESAVNSMAGGATAWAALDQKYARNNARNAQELLTAELHGLPASYAMLTEDWRRLDALMSYAGDKSTEA